MQSGDVHVFHVEDNPAFADRTREHLERAGMSVESESDPERALARLDRTTVDCVVSNDLISERSGLDVLDAVRERYPDLPFVLFAGEADEGIVSEAVDAGVDGLVRKGSPGQFDLLVHRVENAVDRSRETARLARTESRLEETEARLDRTAGRYQRLLETVPAPIVVFDTEEIKFVNDATAEFVGVESPDSLVGENPMTFFHPDDRDRARERAAAVLGGDDHLGPEEYRVRTVDGDIRHAVMRPAPVVYDGEPAGQVVVDDVTARREVQADLRREKRTLEAAIDAIDDFFFIVDDEGQAIRWNDRVPEVTGYDDETLATMSMAEFFVDEQATLVREGIERMLATGSATVEADVETADGEAIPFEFRGVRMTDEDGTVVGGCGIGRDVRDRRAYERELERYRALIETMDDPMYVVDDRGRFLDVNRAMVDRSGFERSEMLGEYVGEFMDPEDIQGVTELVYEILQDPDRSSGTYEFETQDAHGRTRTVQDRVSVLTDEEGNYVCTAGVLRDVTRERAQRRQLHRQNERLDRFAGLVSHDLRNPINVVQGFVDLAEESGDPDAFDRIRAATGRMESLVEDMLMLARHGAVVNDREPITLESAARNAWRTVDTGDATLAVDADRSLEADPERFSSLLENLFRNSVEHGSTDPQDARDNAARDDAARDTAAHDDGDGEGDLTVRVVATEDGFALADDGCGLPDDRVGLFEYGVSYDDGTGLGLAIVHEICEAHGWEIRAGDADAGGARFDVVF